MTRSVPVYKLHCLLLALAGLAWALAFPTDARACGFGNCTMNSMALQPFGGMPFMPMGYTYYYGSPGPMMGGYMPGFDPVYVSNFLNWNGAQPLGLAVSPPLGGSAIFNDAIYSRMASGMAR